MSNVLVVSVHPDDETLGAGATLLRHKKNGDKVFCLLLTAAWEPAYGADAVAKQARLVEELAGAYPFDSLEWLKFPTTRLDVVGMRELVSKISEAFLRLKPEVVYLPNPGDAHHDHAAAFKAAWNCTKNFRYPSVKEVYAMEVPSETNFSSSLVENAFVPNTFVDVTEFWERKKSILSIFEGELGPHPFPRSMESIDALGTLRGSMCGCKYAEAFMLLKRIK